MNRKEAEYVLLDVFTDRKYGGNQLAIFTDASDINPQQFQVIARELNLSETVFLFPPNTREDNYEMRIFTPSQELPTAGHPTVGTAFYLSQFMDHPENGTIKITLKQKVGNIEVAIEYRDGQTEMVTMHQPLPYFGHRHDDKRALIASILSIAEEDIDDLPIEEISCGNNTLIVPLKSIEALGKIAFNSSLWKELKPLVNDAFLYAFTIHGVKAGNVQGRMFAPEVGILEDPATGSANGPLICYITKYDLVDRPVLSLQGYEMGRPSQLHLNTEKNESNEITSVQVGGKSVMVGQGIHFL